MPEAMLLMLGLIFGLAIMVLVWVFVSEARNHQDTDGRRGAEISRLRDELARARTEKERLRKKAKHDNKRAYGQGIRSVWNQMKNRRR